MHLLPKLSTRRASVYWLYVRCQHDAVEKKLLSRIYVACVWTSVDDYREFVRRTTTSGPNTSVIKVVLNLVKCPLPLPLTLSLQLFWCRRRLVDRVIMSRAPKGVFEPLE
jgi:hypothetical protein